MKAARARRRWLKWKRYQDRIDRDLTRPRWWETGRTGAAGRPVLCHWGYYMAGLRYELAGRYAGRHGVYGIRNVRP